MAWKHWCKRAGRVVLAGVLATSAASAGAGCDAEFAAASAAHTPGDNNGSDNATAAGPSGAVGPASTASTERAEEPARGGVGSRFLAEIGPGRAGGKVTIGFLEAEISFRSGRRVWAGGAGGGGQSQHFVRVTFVGLGNAFSDLDEADARALLRFHGDHSAAKKAESPQVEFAYVCWEHPELGRFEKDLTSGNWTLYDADLAVPLDTAAFFGGLSKALDDLDRLKGVEPSARP